MKSILAIFAMLALTVSAQAAKETAPAEQPAAEKQAAPASEKKAEEATAEKQAPAASEKKAEEASK